MESCNIKEHLVLIWFSRNSLTEPFLYSGIWVGKSQETQFGIS